MSRGKNKPSKAARGDQGFDPSYTAVIQKSQVWGSRAALVRTAVSSQREKLSAIPKFKASIIMLRLLLWDQVSPVHLLSAVSLGGLV